MISVTVLTKNVEKMLAETLSSLSLFPEVLVIDTGSTDHTLEIARAFANVKVIEETFMGFGPLHNKAALLATHDWVLSIDSDEVLSKELVQEILHTKLDPDVVYAIERDNYFNGKRIKCCSGWYPDSVARLYHRGSSSFTNDIIHEKIKTKGLAVKKLQGKLKHTPYPTIEMFLAKMQMYSTLFVEQNKHRKKIFFITVVVYGFFSFFRSYILKRGILGGKEGFIISLYNGHTTYYKYLKLYFSTLRKR